MISSTVRASLARSLAALAGAACLTLLTGCGATAPKVEERPDPAQQYSSAMQAADEAQKSGKIPEALEQLDRARIADPAKKDPWLRMAQLQFEARNYGAAITAAQETLQRDNTETAALQIAIESSLQVLKAVSAPESSSKADLIQAAEAQFASRNYSSAIILAQNVLERDKSDPVAISLIAAGGARVSGAAFDQLRQTTKIIGKDTRDEARKLAEVIRDILKEPIIVRQPSSNAGSAGAGAAGSSAPSRTAPSRTPSSGPSTSGPSTSGGASIQDISRPASQPSAPPSRGFGGGGLPGLN